MSENKVFLCPKLQNHYYNLRIRKEEKLDHKTIYQKDTLKR
uniref:Uncharacterized protein n=1 Tax=Rhizophora mucronata TaxID=61149 RepID=A0A2P2QVD1_RHIMU